MIPIEEAHLKYSVSSHPGEGSSHNEDRYGLQAYQLSEESDQRAVLALVADGVGRQRAGEVAAQIVVESVNRAVAQTAASQPASILQAAIIQAGQAVLVQSERDADKRGMGSTCLCAWVIGNRLYAASVGNSRMFLLRQGRMQLLNVPSELAGEEQSEDAETLRGNLGTRQRVDVDLRIVLRPGGEARAERNQGARLQPNDRLLLCTDGLTDTLKEGEIRQILKTTEIDQTADALVQAALDRGAQDNLTAIVLGVPPAKPEGARRAFSLRRVLVTSAVIVLMTFLSLLGWYLWGERLNGNLTPVTTPVSTLTPAPIVPTTSP